MSRIVFYLKKQKCAIVMILSDIFFNFNVEKLYRKMAPDNFTNLKASFEVSSYLSEKYSHFGYCNRMEHLGLVVSINEYEILKCSHVKVAFYHFDAAHM